MFKTLSQEVFFICYHWTMAVPLTEISRAYGLTLSVVKEVSGGFRSKNYIVTDGGKNYFLKKHRNGSRQHVENVCLAERFFADGGVPVILPMRTKQGECLVDCRPDFYSLYPFVNGRHIKRGTLTEAAAASLGSTLAILHKRGKESTLNAAEEFYTCNTAKFLSDVDAIKVAISQERPLSEFGSVALNSVRLKERAVTKEAVEYDRLSLSNDHLIHGDYFCDNVFFGDDDRVSHVFDFERIQYAPPMYELFRSMFVTFLSIPNQENLLLAKKYIDAYRAIYPFPREVVKSSLAAAYQKQMQSLWIEGGHYLDGNTRADSLLSSQYACNRYYVENRDEIEAYLLGSSAVWRRGVSRSAPKKVSRNL